MKKVILVVIFLIATGISQENIQVTSIKTLINPPVENATVFMNPKWSPDGRKIGMTTANFRGLWIYDIQNGKLDQISDEISAGFGYSWSASSQHILSRVSSYMNNRRMSAIKIFHLGDTEVQNLSDYGARPRDIPRWTPDNRQVYFYNGMELEFLNSGIEGKTTAEQTICYAVSDRIFRVNLRSGEKAEFRPVPGAIYLNVNISPDQQYVAFEVYAGNCMVLNLNNGNLTDLGKGNYPRWSADGKYLVYMITQDDGHRYTASDVVISDREGTFFHNLTAGTDQIAMYPSWSPVENKIVYSTYELGSIEMIEFVK